MPGCRRSTVADVAEISGATWDDLDDVYELLDVRSRATLGHLGAEARASPRPLDAAGASPSDADNWVAREDGRIVGYAAVDAAQELEHAAKDAEVGDALLARAEERARERGFNDAHRHHRRPEDAPLQSLFGAPASPTTARSCGCGGR